MIQTMILLLLLSVIVSVKCQCYEDSDISIYQSMSHPGDALFYQKSNNQCIANFTLVNGDFVDDDLIRGITCIRKGSNATGMDATWTYDGDGTVIDCGNSSIEVDCERLQPGSVTLSGAFMSDTPYPNGNYTCCIEGLCVSIRLYDTDQIRNVLYPNATVLATLESCAVIPPTNMTVIPQHYLVQMVTTGVPPSRLTSFINCTAGCGTETTLGETYYTLIHLNNETFQYTLPVTWSANSTSNMVHSYTCSVQLTFVNASNPKDDYILGSKNRKTTITAANTPTAVDYSALNVTAINITWSISGDVNGFVINITSCELETVTEQVNDSSVRWFVVNGLKAERNYSIEVRGYYELLGPPSKQISVKINNSTAQSSTYVSVNVSGYIGGLVFLVIFIVILLVIIILLIIVIVYIKTKYVEEMYRAGIFDVKTKAKKNTIRYHFNAFYHTYTKPTTTTELKESESKAIKQGDLEQKKAYHHYENITPTHTATEPRAELRESKSSSEEIKVKDTKDGPVSDCDAVYEEMAF